MTHSMSGATADDHMNPPSPPVDQETLNRASDVVEFLAKAGGLAGIVWAFVVKVWKPYYDWRRKRMATLMRDVMKDELAELAALIEREEGCAQKIENVVAQITTLFGEHDMLLDVVFDNRDRHDETNQLLDALGFTTDRRSDVDRRTDLEGMIDKLAERRRERRRQMDIKRANANPSH